MNRCTHSRVYGLNDDNWICAGCYAKKGNPSNNDILDAIAENKARRLKEMGR